MSVEISTTGFKICKIKMMRLSLESRKRVIAEAIQCQKFVGPSARTYLKPFKTKSVLRATMGSYFPKYQTHSCVSAAKKTGNPAPHTSMFLREVRSSLFQPIVALKLLGRIYH